MLQVPASLYEIRCRQCRDNDWSSGGWGRADLMGHAEVTEDGRLFVDARPRSAGPGTTAVVSSPLGLREKCRHGHRRQATLEEIQAEIDRAARLGLEEIYI